MRSTVRHRFTGALLALSLAALPAGGHADEASAKHQLDALGQKIHAASERLGATAEERSDAERKLKEVESALADIHARLDDVQTQRRELTEESDALKQRRTKLEKTRQAQLDALATQLAALYRLGNSPQLKLLLNQGNPAELDRMQAYLNRLSRARNQRLADIARLDDALSQNANKLADRRQRLDAANQTLKQDSAALARRTDKRRKLLATLDQREQTQSQHLAELEQNHEQAEQRLREIREQMARLSSPTPSTQMAKTRGDLPWPVQGSISADYQRQKGVHHNGITIASGAGTPVKAVHEGRVVFADWIRGFGNLLIIDHGDHIMTLYAHLQRFTHRPGEQVASGDVIGHVGDSGGQSRAALYFEVRRNGKPINPRRWIARR
ncbi:MAG: peptidoglycan DD-metalloendopeptidase family protein [Halomonas subglaciescola]|nr:peptidoglycan DD-metalloendopeptidase family protein [Halomonas subglaciescola]